MCIRDSNLPKRVYCYGSDMGGVDFHADERARIGDDAQSGLCLLYTSDDADERSSVDLGGRRIIKKKTTQVEESKRAR